MEPDELTASAHKAIADGKDPQWIAAKYRELTGHDLPSPAVAMGQIGPTFKPGTGAAVIEPPALPQIQSDATSWPTGSPQNPSGKVQGDAIGRAVIGMLNPVNMGVTAATMAMPPVGIAGRLATAGIAGGLLGGANAAMEAPAGQRMDAFGSGFKSGAETGLKIAVPSEALLGLGAGIYTGIKTPSSVEGLAGDVAGLREQAQQTAAGIKKNAAEARAVAESQAQMRTGQYTTPEGLKASDMGFGVGSVAPGLEGGIASRADEAASALKDRAAAAEGQFQMRTGEYKTPGGLTAADQGFGVGAVAPALAEGVTTQAAQQAALESGKAGINTANQIRSITGFNEPVDVMQGQVKQGKQLVGELRYGPLEGPMDDPKLLAFIRSPELSRDLRAVAPEVADGLRPPTFSEMQDFRNRFRAGNQQDKQMFGQITRLMEEARPGLGETADQPYAQFSSIGRQQAAAQKAGSWSAAKLRNHLSSLSDPEANAFKETYVQNNLIDQILKKESGAPAIGTRLAGGPQMDERLQAVLTPDQFAQVKQTIADHNAALDQIEAQKGIALNTLNTGRSNAIGALEQQRNTELNGINAALAKTDAQKNAAMAQLEASRAGALGAVGQHRDAVLGGINANEAAGNQAIAGVNTKIDALDTQRRAMEAQAQLTAKRIRDIIKFGATAAGAGTLGGLAYRYAEGR